MSAVSTGFSPVARADATVLILGSLPGRRSIEAGEYYAHPRNAFWPIMRELVGARGSYEQRCEALLDRKIALWDVLHQSIRPGSMDADIRLETAQPNDFNTFLAEHPGVHRICFNGRKAGAMFARFVELDTDSGALEFLSLPSTSAAHASMQFEQKLQRWREILVSADDQP